MTACRLHALSLKVVPLLRLFLRQAATGNRLDPIVAVWRGSPEGVSTRLAEKQPLGSVLLQLNCFALLLFLKGKSAPGTHDVFSHRLTRFVRLARSYRSVYSPV